MKKWQNCLGCYQKLLASEVGGYHISCSKKLFGTANPPIVDFSADQLEELAKQSLVRQLGLTGVQPKISVNIEKHKDAPAHRLMIVGLWGGYILKPPTKRFPNMAVVEDATMHMAKAAGIRVAHHGLIRLKSGELAYVSRRFDRGKKGKKIAVEDFCQLSGLLTESKYKTSTEKAGKIILKYASNSGLDAVSFFDLNLFSFLTGDADRHLKNFSLLTNEVGEVSLSPAYDLLSTKLMPIADLEEMALTVNGRKAKIKRADFEQLGRSLGIPSKAIENSFARLVEAVPSLGAIIDASFLPADLKIRYKELVASRARRLSSLLP